MTPYNRAQPMPLTRIRRALTALLAAGTILGAALIQSSAAAGPPLRAHVARGLSIGISDDSPATFSDPRFRWLGIRTARLVVPWDVAKVPARLAVATAWLEAAHAHRVTPLVAFNVDIEHPKVLPSLLAYGNAVKAFMKLFPWVHEFSAWNEENHYLQPTAKDPHRAAQYFNLFTLLCRSCVITAADVLDIPNMAEWVRTFLHYAHHPHYWGLHNYVDLSAGQNSRTSLFLSIVPGEVWFTETGGVVWRFEKGPGGRGGHYVIHNEAYAAQVASHLLGLAAISSRVRRIYYYQWRVPHDLAWARKHGKLGWDSGLLRPDCGLRPAFSIIARAVGRNPGRAPHVKHDAAGDCV